MNFSIHQRLPTRTHHALRFEDRNWTFAELHQQAETVAAGLQDKGIGPADRVAFLLPNGPELILLNLACLQLGAVAVPLNMRLKGAELAYILGHCRAKLCVAHAEWTSMANPFSTAASARSK